MLLTEDISDVELKQRWRLYWIHCIFEFSTIKLQKMSWVEGPEAIWPNDEVWESSFGECMSAYFDTLALDDAYAKAISDQQALARQMGFIPQQAAPVEAPAAQTLKGTKSITGAPSAGSYQATQKPSSSNLEAVRKALAALN